MLFRILFVFDMLGLLGVLYFFVDGLQYSPGTDYMVTWAPILLVVIGALVLAWTLKRKGKAGWANVLLGVLALPFLALAAFAGLFILIAPDMK